MKNILVSLCLFLSINFFGFSQDYKTHKVQSGETIESIAKHYLVTPYDIYALNPDAKESLDPDMIIVIPKSRISDNPVQSEVKELQGFRSHKVGRKETLYSISKRYDITIDEIKKHNNRLYSENLRKGDHIQIPQYKTVIVTQNLENTIRKYIVQPKEGKWRIAYTYGITIEELDQLNPKMNETLQVGDEINVPNIADNEEKLVDENFGYYTVQPKEGFYRLKIKLGVAQDELERLNPELVDSGLKSGMVLKVPKEADENLTLSMVEQTSLVNKIKNFKTKRIAVMLPFRLNRVDLDSINEVRDILERDNYMSIAVDFHTGVLMALDSLKRFGISTTLDVYDTQARISEVASILSKNDFSKYDAVIGPFTQDGFDRTAETLKSDDVPVISAVTKPKELYRNVFQTIPSEDFLRKLIVNYVRSDSTPHTIVIISDSKSRRISDELKQEFTFAKQIFSRKNKEGQDANYILLDDIKSQLKPGKNIVFLETVNEGFVSNVSSMLSALNGKTIEKIGDKENEIERELILMTTNMNRAFEGTNISNIDLNSLQFHYPTINRSYDSDVQNTFVSSYKRIYGTDPNRYAVRGFDLTMDVLLRLSSEDDFYKASLSDIETEYVENKFRYSKKLFGGYYNEAAYIVKYQDLKLVEVKQ